MPKLLINRGKNDVDIVRTHLDSEKKLEARLKEKQKLDEECLVYAEGKKIYVSNKQRFVLIGERGARVNSICLHNNKLYDSSDGYIVETVTGHVVASRSSSVNALCSHEQNLYDAGTYGIDNTFLGPLKGVNRGGSIFALCEHNGELIDAGDYRGLYQTFHGLTGKKIAEGYSDPTQDLCSYKNNLYYTSQSWVFEAKTDKYVVQRDYPIEALFVRNGKMYDISDSTTQATIGEGSTKVAIPEKIVTAACVVPGELARELIKNAKSTNK